MFGSNREEAIGGGNFLMRIIRYNEIQTKENEMSEACST
jgi:hypothetical protein